MLKVEYLQDSHYQYLWEGNVTDGLWDGKIKWLDDMLYPAQASFAKGHLNGRQVAYEPDGYDVTEYGIDIILNKKDVDEYIYGIPGFGKIF